MTSSDSKPIVSIVSSVERNWLDLASRFVASLENQQAIELSRVEVVIVDGFGDTGHADALSELLATYSGPLRLRLHVREKCCRAAAMNHGIERSDGDLLLLLADDFIPTPALVGAHLEFHRANPDERFIGIGPGIFPPDWELTPFMHWLDHEGNLFGIVFTGEQAKTPPPGFFYGANTSIKRAFLERAGPFDEDFPFDCGDDAEMGIRLRRLGMHSVYLPEAIAHHWHEQGLDDGRLRGRMSGVSAALLDLKMGGSSRLQAGLEKHRNIRFRKPKDMKAYWQAAIQHEYCQGYVEAATTLLEKEPAG